MISLAGLMISSAMLWGGGHRAAGMIRQSDFEGRLVCPGCDLKQAGGVRVACRDYAHRHALKTGHGKYIDFPENQYSEELIIAEKYRNQRIKVSGLYYAEAKIPDVKIIQVDGTKKY